MADDNGISDDNWSSPDGTGNQRFGAPLPQKDNPISEPDGVVPTDEDNLDDTHPVTDTNLQVEEDYDEGISGAAEASEPNAGDSVVGYDPEKDQRKKQDYDQAA